MKNGRKNISSKTSQNAEKKHSDLVKHTFIKDHWLLLHFIAIFAFSLAVGLLTMHAAFLYHQWEYGYGLFESSSRGGGAMEELKRRMLKQYGELGAEQYEELAKYGILKVNTSIFVK